ncbi:MAG TPA: enolase C-terminal domain-like protein [Tepidiformaceae bacterium]
MTDPNPAGLPLVSRAWWRPFRVPFRSEFVAAHGTMSVREGIVLVLETDGGDVGLGEASPLPSYSGGSVEETGAAIEVLVRELIGQPADAAWRRDLPLANVSAGSAAAARCAVEAASADLCSRAASISFRTWIARQGGIEATAKRIAVNGTIDAGDPGDAAREAKALVSNGFQTLKLKVGTGPAADLARIAAVREAIGDAVALRIDANGAWGPADATAVLDRCPDYRIALCEQPISHLAPDAIGQLALVRGRSPIPVAADESCRSLSNLDSLLAAMAVDAIVVKPMASGLREAIRMVARAREKGVPVIVTTMFDCGIGTTVAMHLAALTGPNPIACGLATLDHLVSSLVEADPTIVRGTVELTGRPGLDLRLDPASLERYTTGPRRELGQ